MQALFATHQFTSTFYVETIADSFISNNSLRFYSIIYDFMHEPIPIFKVIMPTHIGYDCSCVFLTLLGKINNRKVLLNL
jgi:hypothetical protein